MGTVGTVTQTTVTVRDVKGNQGRQECQFQVGASGVCLSPVTPTPLPETGTSGVVLATRNVRSVTVNRWDVRSVTGKQECQGFPCQQGAPEVSPANRDVRSVTGKQGHQECHYQTGTSGVSLATRDVSGIIGNQGRQRPLSGQQKEVGRCRGSQRKPRMKVVSETPSETVKFMSR